MKLWMGIDVEGENSGEKTLFIGSPDISISEIDSSIKRYSNITQLYFGAGGGTEVDRVVLLEAYNRYKNIIITVECTIDNFRRFGRVDQFKDINYMIIINHDNFSLFKNFDGKKVQIKLQSLNVKDKILLTSSLNSFDSVDTTKLKDNKYDGDVILL